MKWIFISYAKEDTDTAVHLYMDLKHEGLDPWLDSKNIEPGKNWRDEIQNSIRNSRYVLALLSSSAVNKRGYVQVEIRKALDMLNTFPPGDVFVIPVRIDDCRPRHEVLEDLQWVDLFPSYQEGLRKLLSVLRTSKAFNEAVILWVDDNHSGNQVQIDTLRRQGLTIELASSTNEAFKLLKDFHFDVIISDLFRDEGGIYYAAGYELLEMLSDEHVTTPVIIYTRSSNAVDKQKARSAFGIAEMPFQVYQLIMAALTDVR